MYGQLAFDPADADAPWTVSYFMCAELQPPALTPAQAAQRGAALGQIRHNARQVSNAQLDALKRVASALPANTGDLLSDLYFALAHWQLPEARRRAREDRITATLQAYDDGQPWPAIAPGIEHIRCLAPLVPDPYLEVHVASQVARLQMTAMKSLASALRMGPFLLQLDARCAPLGFEVGSPEKEGVLTACFTRPVGARRAFLDLLDEVGRRGLGDAVRQTLEALRGTGLLTVTQGDVLEGVLRDGLAAGPDAPARDALAAIAADRVAQARALDAARAQTVIDLTIDALHAGVDFGPVVQPLNEQAVARADLIWRQQQLRMTPQRLRLLRVLDERRAARAAGRPAPAAGEPPDIDPVHAWSVQRLVQWIGGPVADPAPRRLDRRAIAAQEQSRRRDARRAMPAPATVERADADFTEADVALAVRAALGSTADFQAGDMEDMRYRARALGIASPALAACEALLEPLRRLAAGAVDDEQAARQLLHRAEAASGQLRLLVRAGEQDARLRQRFAQQLEAALAQSTLEEGRRRGGQIRCPLGRDDWGWVSARYHQRWLPWARSVVVDGVAQPLRPDQALALYVTGRSLSGFEFDVSVHLWLRKPGRASPPALGSEPYAPMNGDDWVDTYVPCTVLHVPAAG